jgi:flagellar hook-basal body complex protein FliE
MRPVTVNTVERPAATPSSRLEEPQAATPGAFAEALQSAVAKVDALQTASDTEASKLAGGEGNLHETMLALEKADVAMKVAMKVRNKFVDAYNEVMRMSV